LFVVSFKFYLYLLLIAEQSFLSINSPYSNPSLRCPSLPRLSPPFKVSRATQGQFPQLGQRTYPRRSCSSSRKLTLSMNQFIPNPYIFSPQFYGPPGPFHRRRRLPSNCSLNYILRLALPPRKHVEIDLVDQVHTRISGVGNVINITLLVAVSELPVLISPLVAPGYSIISPITNGLAVLAFFLFYPL
jgi:hypothetical protein